MTSPTLLFHESLSQENSESVPGLCQTKVCIWESYLQTSTSYKNTRKHGGKVQEQNLMLWSFGHVLRSSNKKMHLMLKASL